MHSDFGELTLCMKARAGLQISKESQGNDLRPGIFCSFKPFSKRADNPQNIHRFLGQTNTKERFYTGAVDIKVDA